MTLRTVLVALLAFTGAVAVVFLAGIAPRSLTPVAVLLTAAAWVSCALLTRAALRKPRIGALTERAFIALVIAILGTVSCLIALNTDSGRPLFDANTASLVFRLAIIAVLGVPTLWLYLLFTDRLGQGDA